MPRPAPGAGEVLVRVLACGLCGTDLHKYRHATVPQGTVLGHEILGEVSGVGVGVDDFSVGQRVLVFHHAPCFVCDRCRRGHYSLCPAFRPTQIDPGGFAEYVLVKKRGVEHLMLPVPESVGDEDAALVECAACCLRAILRSGIEPSDRVAVIGAGPVGLVHLLLLRAVGAGNTVMFDVRAERLEAAGRFGAGLCVDASGADPAAEYRELLGADGADVVIIAAASPAAVELGMKCAGPGGVVSFFAECPPESVVPLDPNRLYHSELTLMGSYSSSPKEQRMVLGMLESGRVSFKELVTDAFPLEETAEAFRTAESGTGLKILVRG